MDKIIINDLLQTPLWVYKPLGHIDLDPCAGKNTDIAKVNYRLEDNRNGLEEEWHGFVFCNPPFSQKLLWIEKMISHKNGILLLPERGSTPWHGPCAQKAGYHFTMGKKINFIGGSSSNPTGSTLFLFGDLALSKVLDSELTGTLNKVIKYKDRY